ncbi:MAG: PKD domain-containing protein [Bacteroidota bacterium]
MLKTITTLFSILVFCSTIFAQSGVFSADQLIDPLADPQLKRQFSEYKLFEIDAKEVFNYVSQDDRTDFQLSLQLGTDQRWDMQLETVQLFANHYRLTAQTANGVEMLPNTRVRTYKGALRHDPSSRIRMTLTNDMVYGMIELQDETWFIEPTSNLLDNAPPKQYVVYAASKVLQEEEMTCGYDALMDKTHELEHEGHSHAGHNHNPNNRMMCLGVEIAMAADYSMVTKFGSAAGVEGHLAGILNNVQSNYDNEFSQQILFNIVEIFVSSCNGCDPWNPTTDAGALLNSFRAWGGGGGFPNVGASFDVAQMWTNRNFNGSTIGIAWLRAICTNLRFNVCQDFSSNASLLRVLSAHELGHNFGSNHDGSGIWIMSPSVNTATSWSNNSISVINGLLPSYSCLGDCQLAFPPNAQFSFIPGNDCAPMEVRFLDQSTNEPTTWFWIFEGGTPSVSNLPNPVVTYAQPGIYSVTLTVSNDAGQDVETLSNIINVRSVPQVSFISNTNFRTVSFLNQTQDGFTYEWDFGDGNFSTQTNPEHTYNDDGIYSVTLTASNDCGSATFVNVLNILTPPFPAFRADREEGCDEMTVTFENFSTSNSESFVWEFPGGIPSTSTEAAPTVFYATPGVYDVTLIASNGAGQNTETKTSFIKLGREPIAAFDYAVNGQTIDFMDQSQFADNVFWDFGDGTTSTEESPSHLYAGQEVYELTLIAESICGSDTTRETITTRPTIAFVRASQTAIESNADGMVDCRGYRDFTIELETSRAISGGDAIVTIESTGSAMENVDYEVIDGVLTFPNNESTTQSFTLRVFDDEAVEDLENIDLSFSISGDSDAFPGRNKVLDFTIRDRGLVYLLEEGFEDGNLPSGWSRSQNAGADGWQFGSSFSLSSDDITLPGRSLENIAGANDNACNCDAGADVLRTAKIDLSNVADAELVFDAYFTGQAGSTSEIRVTLGDDPTEYPLLTVPAVSDQWQRGLSVNLSQFLGEPELRLLFVHNDNGLWADGFFIDNVQVRGEGRSNQIANDIHNTTQQYLGPFSTVYFHDDATDRLLLKIENLTDWNYGCTTVEIDRAGLGAEPFTVADPEFFLTRKTLIIEPANNSQAGKFRITMFFNENSLSSWEAITGNSRGDMTLIQSPGQIRNITPNTPFANGSFANGNNNEAALNSATKAYAGINLAVTGEFWSALGGVAGGSGLGAAPLPVEFLYFTGEALARSINLLEWSTASETNSSHFVLERSKDGRTFEEVTKVAAAGFTNEQQFYQFEDRQAHAGINYYRLNQVDMDGRSSYSNVIILEYLDELAAVNIFPNPTEGQLQISWTNIEEPLIISVYSTAGRLLQQHNLADRSATNMDLDLSQLADGIYFIKVETTEEVITYERIVKR